MAAVPGIALIVTAAKLPLTDERNRGDLLRAHCGHSERAISSFMISLVPP